MSATTTPTPLPAATHDTWIGTGHVHGRPARDAGREAAHAATAGRTASLLLVFCPADDDIEHVLAGVREHADESTVIAGASAMALLGPDGPTEDGVVVLALGAGFEVRAHLAPDAAGDRRAAGEAAAAAAAELSSDHRLLMLLCDGLTTQQHAIVRGAYSVLGAFVPLIGGCAADAMLYERTYQFIGGRDHVDIVSDTVVGIGIGAAHPFHSLGVEHGWHTVGDPMVVTSSADGMVHELDGRPALEVYLQRTGFDPALVEDDAAFHEAAFARPLGLSRRDGIDIRVIHAGHPETGSLECLADVPQGALVWTMDSRVEDLVSAGVASCEAAIAGHPGTPSAILLFDCGARKVVLGEEQTRDEVRALVAAAGDIPVVGMYTFGEIARQVGSRGMHHLTCAALAIG